MRLRDIIRLLIKETRNLKIKFCADLNRNGFCFGVKVLSVASSSGFHSPVVCPQCQRLTGINNQFVLQVVEGLFGHVVGVAVPGLVLVQQVADLLDLLQQTVVFFIHQSLNPAA